MHDLHHDVPRTREMRDGGSHHLHSHLQLGMVYMPAACFAGFQAVDRQSRIMRRL
jgi:hypothetical protein